MWVPSRRGRLLATLAITCHHKLTYSQMLTW
jgi:hypothetical protein